MKIEDYPGNDEINELRQAILELEKTKSWEAMVHAKTDLYSEIKKREEWIKENVDN